MLDKVIDMRARQSFGTHTFLSKTLNLPVAQQQVSSARRFTRTSHWSGDKNKSHNDLDVSGTTGTSEGMNTSIGMNTSVGIDSTVGQGRASQPLCRDSLRTILKAERHKILKQSAGMSKNRTLQDRDGNVQNPLYDDQKERTRLQMQTEKPQSIATARESSGLRAELEFKEKSIKILQKECMKLKNDIEQARGKQENLKFKLDEALIHSRKHSEQMQTKLRETEASLHSLMSENERLRKEVWKLSNDKKEMETAMETMTQKIPSNIREWQSHRETSLLATLEQLKSDCNRDKTDVERCLQATIRELQGQKQTLVDHINSLEIKSRLKDKNFSDSKKYLQAYTLAKAQCKSIRKECDYLANECQMLRVENVRMKKEVKRQSLGKKASHNHMSVKEIRTAMSKKNEEDDNESLSYSLVSTCSK